MLLSFQSPVQPVRPWERVSGGVHKQFLGFLASSLWWRGMGVFTPDYRGLNDVTVKRKYPLPLTNPSFEPLCHTWIFNKLHLWNTYHLIHIQEGDQWKTAFNTPLGHFEYKVMPFSLSNTPTVFWALISDILRGQFNHFVGVYLGDILIFSRTLEEHCSDDSWTISFM